MIAAVASVGCDIVRSAQPARLDMTRDESKTLKTGARVCWKGSKEGTVTGNDWSAVKITWDDKTMSVTHHNDMGDVAISKKKDG